MQMTGSGTTDAEGGGATASQARRPAEEHAALRRIAMLIARQKPQAEVFTTRIFDWSRRNKSRTSRPTWSKTTVGGK